MEDGDRPVIFVHVPKTAGTTIKAIIAGQYGDDKVLLGPGTGEQLLEIGRLDDEQRNKIKMIAGHLPVGFPNLVDNPRYCTLLREPIDRVVSFYYYVRREPEHYLYDYTKIQGHSLREVMENRVSNMMDNFQTRLISGVWNVVPFGEMTPEFLDRAKRNIDTFAVVGLQERFDESMLMLADAFGWDTPYYRSRNVSEGRPRVSELDDETLALVAAANTFDTELYEYAKEIFARQLAAKGPGFARRVAQFKRANRRRDRRADFRRNVIAPTRAKLRPIKRALVGPRGSKVD